MSQKLLVVSIFVKSEAHLVRDVRKKLVSSFRFNLGKHQVLLGEVFVCESSLLHNYL